MKPASNADVGALSGWNPKVAAAGIEHNVEDLWWSAECNRAVVLQQRYRNTHTVMDLHIIHYANIFLHGQVLGC